MTTHVLAAAFDSSDPVVRSEAESLAERLRGDTPVESAVRSILDAVAQGERVMVMYAEDEVTPAGAARLLGVTRQFVDRLCDDGVLAFRRLPDSRHRRIRVEDVLTVAKEREQRRAGGDAIRSAVEA